MGKRQIITFLSDYGLQDEFVGVCHGVILRVAPGIQVVHLHHNILRQDIRHGAIVLQQSVRYLSDSVHLAVVDPSVGSGRRALVLETGWGEVFVGPDNGLLIPAANDCGGITRAFEITDRRFMLTPVSRTFQGRDVFAPAAAHVAAGVEPSEMGPALDVAVLVQLEIPAAWIHDDHLHGEVLQVDRFGNLQLNVEKLQLEELGLVGNGHIEIRMEGHRLQVPFGATFADVELGEFILVEDSYRQLSLAINNGDAAAHLRARAGSTAIVGPTTV